MGPKTQTHTDEDITDKAIAVTSRSNRLGRRVVVTGRVWTNVWYGVLWSPVKVHIVSCCTIVMIQPPNHPVLFPTVLAQVIRKDSASDDGEEELVPNLLKAVVYVAGDTHRSIGTDAFIPGWGVKVAAKESNLDIKMEDITISTPRNWIDSATEGSPVPKELNIKAPALVPRLSSNGHEGLKAVAEGAGFAEFLCLEIPGA